MRIHRLVTALSILAAVGVAQAFRNVVYLDESYQQYGKNETQDEIKKEFTHVILSFANPLMFLNGPLTKPFQTPDKLRDQFGDNVHFGLAIGGWVWLDGFADAADETKRQTFATNVNEILTQYEFDFVDIDWEYPGAKRLGKNQNLEKEKADFPGFLATLNETIKEKYVTVAVGGKLLDDSTAAFNGTANKDRAKEIASHVAFINIMTYDLTNRADTKTGHHTAAVDAWKTVKQYLDWGYPAEKLNLGFAMYAKHFRTVNESPSGDCKSNGLGCEIEPAQDANGEDTGTSGWLTFEWKNLVDVRAVNPGERDEEGTCGLNITLQSYSKCDTPYCCSKENYCGKSDLYCGAGCQPFFSDDRCTENLDLRASFATAQTYKSTDEELGAVSYWDKINRVFWTWETPDMMRRKFKKTVRDENLGGVFTWNLGQDTFNWEHFDLIRNETASINKERASTTSTPEGTSPAASTPEATSPAANTPEGTSPATTQAGSSGS